MEEQNKEIIQDMNEWKKLIDDTRNLKKSYEEMVADIRMMKEDAIKVSYGNKLRYKLARLLMK